MHVTKESILSGVLLALRNVKSVPKDQISTPVPDTDLAIVFVLIAHAGGKPMAWHLARSECAAAWAAPMARIPAPTMAVSDGLPGLAKAAAAMWPGARIQRCTRHAADQARRCTTLNPRLDAGKELLAIANRLGEAKDAEKAARWLADYAEWCSKWQGCSSQHRTGAEEATVRRRGTVRESSGRSSICLRSTGAE